MLRWIKRLLIWGIGLAVIGVIVYGFMPKPVAADLARVTKGELRVFINEDGKTRIKDKFIISSPLSGQLLRVVLEPGDPVEKLKTVVAHLEPDLPVTLDARTRAQAEAKVRVSDLALKKATLTEDTAQKAMLNATKNLNRIRKLRESKSSTEEALELAELEEARRREEYNAAKLAVDIAKYELDWAKMALWELKPVASTESISESNGATFEKREFPIQAPISGKVLRRFKESATPITSGTPILEIGDPHRLEMEIDVLSSDAVQIPPQAKVNVNAWGGPYPLNGVVRMVEPAAFTKISALGVEEQRVNVIVDLIDPPEKRATLGDGYRIEAEIILWETASTIKVPTSALFRKDRDWAVYQVTDGKAKLRIVRIGHRNGLEAEVIQGIDVGDVVIIHPSDQISEGVMITQRTMAKAASE